MSRISNLEDRLDNAIHQKVAGDPKAVRVTLDRPVITGIWLGIGFMISPMVIGLAVWVFVTFFGLALTFR